MSHFHTRLFIATACSLALMGCSENSDNGTPASKSTSAGQRDDALSYYRRDNIDMDDISSTELRTDLLHRSKSINDHLAIHGPYREVVLGSLMLLAELRAIKQELQDIDHVCPPCECSRPGVGTGRYRPHHHPQPARNIIHARQLRASEVARRAGRVTTTTENRAPTQSVRQGSQDGSWCSGRRRDSGPEYHAPAARGCHGVPYPESTWRSWRISRSSVCLESYLVAD